MPAILRYKFCIAIENSISPDYVSEKIWHGLTAGCIPVYLGQHGQLRWFLIGKASLFMTQREEAMLLRQRNLLRC